MGLTDCVIAWLAQRPAEAAVGVLSLLLLYLLRKLNDKAVKLEKPAKPRGVAEDSPFFESALGEEAEGEEAGPGDEAEVAMVPYAPQRYGEEEMVRRSREFYEQMNKRRSVRFFSDEAVPLEVVQNIVRTAGTAPSGGHTEPWSFAIVASPDAKAELRRIVEAEEEVNYRQRMGEEWVADLAKFRTDWVKPYIETAPYTIVVLRQAHGHWADGRRRKHYYSEISVSISVGLLLAAVQNAGLATLTSTPLNAGPQIRQLLGRPQEEKVVLLLPIGRPSKDCAVPDLHRKPLDRISVVV